VTNEWQMPRRGEACDGCRRGFEPGDPIQACLYESPEGYQRRDYCADCEPPDEPVPIGSWKMRSPEPAARKTVTFHREAIFGFFQQLEDAETREQRQLRFVLALLLWRKKVLKFDRSEANDDGEVWHFAVPRTGAAHAVERPDLDEDRLEQLGAQLEGLLASGVGDPSAVASAPNEDQADA
jgi:hypothetical protein